MSIPDRMTPAERRAGISLAAIFALRMLGLFLILPVFASAAATLPGGDNRALVGFALGVFGLTQAVLHIPLGMLSDRIGRKPVIIGGLLVFAVGSLMAALADNLWFLLFARVVQGSGAISAAVTALAADLTREQHRTKVMAMIGSSIGLSFALSLVMAPMLFGWVGLSGLFCLTGGLALGAVLLVKFVIPPEPERIKAAPGGLRQVLINPQLLRLNFGVFALHALQASMWMVVPAALLHFGGLAAAEHWKAYLPALLISFVFMVPAIIVAERRQKLRPVMLAAIVLLIVVQCGFVWAGEGLLAQIAWLTAFFVAFNILEALQPSLTSRIAPASARGAAMGVYNTTQSLGLFLGGALGGTLAQHLGDNAVHLTAAALAFFWLLLSVTMVFPQRPAALAN